jgi:hypothetical protein
MFGQIAVSLATVAASVGQFLDAYTTYVGVDVERVATEGNPSSFTQWLVKHPTVNFILKAGYPAVIGGFALFGVHGHIEADSILPIEVIVSAALSAIAFFGFKAAYGNNQINQVGKEK